MLHLRQNQLLVVARRWAEDYRLPRGYPAAPQREDLGQDYPLAAPVVRDLEAVVQVDSLAACSADNQVLALHSPVQALTVPDF